MERQGEAQSKSSLLLMRCGLACCCCARVAFAYQQAMLYLMIPVSAGGDFAGRLAGPR